MGRLASIYDLSLALLTDLYQVTMAYGYWKLGRAEREAAFHVAFRSPPFDGGYAVSAGQAFVADLLRDLRFRDDDVAYLATLRGADERPLFSDGFYEYLRALRCTCDVRALPEGTLVFAHEPIVRVTGPLLQCQLLESALLNLVNFSTLIATKSARICQAARGAPVLEFGLRRAQGIDGALTASRAAYVGGASATSNVLAGRLFGIPVKGTHAHSWVMSFEDELESFDAYAEALPNNCVFLVDTFDTLAGVRRAVEVGQRLRERGHELVGVRLDSGDLAYLSAEARRILDAGGFRDAQVFASNDLDEQTIESIRSQGAAIGVWGVGTRLVTGHDQPALGGVYKLSALRDDQGNWTPRIKLSEQTAKTSIPGVLQVRRFRNGQGRMVADMIYDESRGVGSSRTVVDPADAARRKTIAADATWSDLLIPLARDGDVVWREESLDTIRARVRDELDHLHAGVRRFLHPHSYPAGLELGLHELRQRMILEAKEKG